MYICIYIYIYMCYVHKYMCIHIYKYIYAGATRLIGLFLVTPGSQMYMSLYNISIHTYIYIYIYIHTHTHKHINKYTTKCANILICSKTYLYLHKMHTSYKRTCTHTDAYTRVHVYVVFKIRTDGARVSEIE